jgi:arginase
LGWLLLGAPLDSAAKGEGEERAPQALRDAGLAEALGARDMGDVAEPLRPPDRDPRSGIVAFEALVDASAAISVAVGDVIGAGDRPLVLGGDCSLLIGAMAGARSAGLRPGLLFVDGHCDYWDGDTSPTGEAADMELAIIHGSGPSVLASMAPRPLADPARTAILGHRPHELDPDVAAERERVPDEVLQFDTPAIREAGVQMSADLAIERAGEGAWLHIDLDALDAEALPAVSYPLADGLGWEELEALLKALAAAGVCGASVADLNSDKDPDGAYAGRVSGLLARVLT